MTYRYRFLLLLAALLVSVFGHWGLISCLSGLTSDFKKPLDQVTQLHFDFSVEETTKVAESAPSVADHTVATNPSVVQKPSSSPVSSVPKTGNTDVVTEEPSTISSSDYAVSPALSAPQAERTSSGGALAAGAIAMVRSAGAQAGVPASERQTAPRKQSITQATKDIRYRQYAEDWRQKVQRVGKVAFPENDDPNTPLRGRVLVRVIVRADGSIAQLGVVRSSKNKVLDAAALNIVRLAAPFSPFPDSIKDEVDLIEITRWWSFEEVFR